MNQTHFSSAADIFSNMEIARIKKVIESCRTVDKVLISRVISAVAFLHHHYQATFVSELRGCVIRDQSSSTNQTPRDATINDVDGGDTGDDDTDDK